ncbi:hypothetical protein LG634_17155 [Streptomyces bambusae]|uniref:hypothetical protein n=1 Tax=Streptomyces bambusae TaxID=1550616 RepID=UPI001CFCB320|nr:hypothetical protein [Streptomyces bambusae]MCB5166558.1 hypothetical protein [Streptomyces bambusae]
MNNLVSALISAFGVLAGMLLLAVAVDDFRSGASVLWLGAGIAILLVCAYGLIRDVRRLRAEPTD